MTAKPRVAITYCRQCQWLLRAAWMAQELLSTFAEDLGEVALLPGTAASSRSSSMARSSGSASATAASPT
jgi:selenoprotein W-related protein